MDLKRFDGTGPVRQYASRSSFQSRIKRRYRLPGIRATTGQKPITEGLTRHDRPFGLVFAAMPKKWGYRSFKWIDNLYIALSLALSSYRNAYSQIRYDKITHSGDSETDPVRIRKNRKSLLNRERIPMRQIGEMMPGYVLSATSTRNARSVCPSGLVYESSPASRRLWTLKYINNLNIALGLALFRPGDAYSKIREDKSTSPGAVSFDPLAIRILKNRKQIRDDTNSRSRNCGPLQNTSSVKGLDRPEDISHSMRIPAKFNQGELAERRETSDKKEYRDHLKLIEMHSPFSRSYKSADQGKIGSLHDHDQRISEKASSLMPSQLELPASRGSIRKYETERIDHTKQAPASAQSKGSIGSYETESSPMFIYENRQSHLGKERTPLEQITERMQFIRTYDPDSIDFELRAPGFASRMIARSIAPPWDMTLIKDASSQSGGNVSSDETGPSTPRSFTEFKSSLPDSNPVLSDALPEGFTPVYRTFPAREAPMQTEVERSVISSSRLPAVTESMQIAPTAQDLHRISDQVCSMIERKLLTERERRGIYG